MQQQEQQHTPQQQQQHTPQQQQQQQSPGSSKYGLPCLLSCPGWRQPGCLRRGYTARQQTDGRYVYEADLRLPGVPLAACRLVQRVPLHVLNMPDACRLA